jgi:glutamine---fructose-6-phosphate transaminase (isomerizing)
MRRAAAALADGADGLERLAAAARRATSIVFTGMGASYDACFAAVTVLGGRGVAAVQVDSAELLHFRRAMLRPDGVLVAVSQSGESAEVVALAEGLDHGDRPLVVAVTNGPDNGLARGADVVIDTRAGAELGPSTLTFSACLVSLGAIAEVLSGTEVGGVVDTMGGCAERAAQAAADVIEHAERDVVRYQEWLTDRSVVAIVGRGSARAAAETGALVLKEAARVPVEALESAQFRHGPLELAGPDAAVGMVVTEPAAEQLERRLAKDLAVAGASVLWIGPVEPPESAVKWVRTPMVEPALAPAVAVIPFQLLAWRLAVQQGRTPGLLSVATKVTTRE